MVCLCLGSYVRMYPLFVFAPPVTFCANQLISILEVLGLLLGLPQYVSGMSASSRGAYPLSLYFRSTV